MKRILTMAIAPVLLAAAGNCGAAGVPDKTVPANRQTVMQSGSQTSFKDPTEYFTGNVKVDMLFAPTKTLPASGARVAFEPGARTAWHTHPAGQTLVVTSGVGLTQEWGGPIVEIRPGDVVKCPAGVRHWHGARPDSAMTHLAITGDAGGKNVEWLEKVTDEQYRGN